MAKGHKNKKAAEITEQSEILFTKLMEKNMMFAYHIAGRFLTEEEDIKDAIQAAFIKAWKSFQQFDPNKAVFQSWLFSIIRNTCIDRIREQRKFQRIPLDQISDIPGDNHADAYDSREWYQIILMLADQLPDKQRDCFIMRDINGLSIREIAMETGQTTGSVKTNVYLARKKIKQWLIEKKITE